MSNIPANFTDGSFTITDDAANSATLLMSQGDLTVSGLVPDGRELVVSQSQGATVLTSIEITEGDTSTIAFTFQIAGPMSFDGTVVVSSR
jgi:hypothetical protein